MVIYHQTKQNITLKHIQDLEEESFLLQTSKENGQFVCLPILHRWWNWFESKACQGSTAARAGAGLFLVTSADLKTADAEVGGKNGGACPCWASSLTATRQERRKWRTEGWSRQRSRSNEADFLSQFTASTTSCIYSRLLFSALSDKEAMEWRICMKEVLAVALGAIKARGDFDMVCAGNDSIVGERCQTHPGAGGRCM